MTTESTVPVEIIDAPVRLEPVVVTLPEGMCPTPPERIIEFLVNYVPCEYLLLTPEEYVNRDIWGSTTTTEVAVPTPDVMQTLPSTGIEANISILATVILVAGILVKRFAR